MGASERSVASSRERSDAKLGYTTSGRTAERPTAAAYNDSPGVQLVQSTCINGSVLIIVTGIAGHFAFSRAIKHANAA